MSFAKQLTVLALILLVGGIQCAVYDSVNKWVKSGKGLDMPKNAQLGGFDPSGYNTFVGRVLYSNSIVAARVVPEQARATFNTDTVSSSATAYEVLVGNATTTYNWVRSYDGYWERDAVSTGTSSANDTLFVCRVKSDGALLIGTLYMIQRVCVVKYETLSLRKFDKYEVLVRVDIPAQFKPQYEIYNN